MLRKHIHIYRRWACDPARSSREGARGRLLRSADTALHRYNASDAIGSLDCPRDIVAGDARDATLKIPRPAAGDPPPHVPKRGREGEFLTYASPSPGRVAAHHRCLLVNLWSYSSNFTGLPPHIRPVDFPYPVGRKSHAPSQRQKEPCRATRYDDPLGLGGGEGMLYVCM